MIAGARVEVAPYKRDPGRFRAVEALDARAARLGQPVGPRPARLAHRMLGDGRSASRRRRSTSTAAASTSSSRTTRTRSRRAAAPTTARRSPASGCTTASSTSRRRRCRSRSATSSWCATCWPRRPGEAIRFALLGAHYRKPLDWSDAGPGARPAGARPALSDAARPARARRGRSGGRRHPPACWRRSRTTSTRRRRSPSCARWRSRPTPATIPAQRRRALKAQLAGWRPAARAAAAESPYEIGSSEAAAVGRQLARRSDSSVGRAEIERLVALRVTARRAKDFAEADRFATSWWRRA